MQKTIQIVIVEDDKDLANGLCKALKYDTRSIVSCEDLKSAREQIFLSNPALIIGSGIMALTLSLIFIPIVNAAADKIFWFYSKHFSVTPVLLIMPLMALIGVFVPLISYKNISKASIVERIREIG